ncbi:MAG: SusD/RagB family nutrient-binding outer membrane lipoprotein [Tannerellaceae bacterium]|nr:SusD/RagB family nutrient-binding outer membrane lipoprotein [Tannerellaceae bacterium]
MKTFHKILTCLAIGILAFTACNDFEDINKDPGGVDEGNVKVSFLLNKSIIGAQQNPNIAERVFVRQWKDVARFDRASSMTVGFNADEWNNEYLSADYGVKWLNHVNMAVKLGSERVQGPVVAVYENNVLQMSRIWRAYIISELADCFGPIAPVNNFDGEINYESVEDIYHFILEELNDAVSKIDTSADMSDIKAEGSDTFYKGDINKWIKYANSLTLRYAMRLSKADPETAKKYFEVAAKGPLITSLSDMAEVQEVDGWDDLAGVMSRSWNTQALSATFNNLIIGLGGIDFQVPEEIQNKVILKDARKDFGIKLDQHLTVKTNAPGAGFFFNALPSKIDPRATVLYSIPGYDDGVILSPYIGVPAQNPKLVNLKTNKVDDNSIELDVNYTWNTWVAGKWGDLSAYSSQLLHRSTFPSLSHVYRTSTNKRVWFGPWETYFLLAEAKVYKWNIPGTAKEHYEAGIRASFEYHGLLNLVDEYLISTEYNRIGTSVAFDHIEEAVSYTASYIDGYTKETKTFTYHYPKNSIYNNGETNHDLLTKIITQKYISQVPWLPLEAWSDHRRLGLPFFGNQAVEIVYSPENQEVPLNFSNYMECRWEFYQQRLPYPASMEVNSKASFDEAVRLLGGKNIISVPLWWTGRNN